MTPATKEIVADADAALGGAWIHRNPRQVNMTRINRSTPGEIGNAIGIVETSSPALIGTIGAFPPCGLNLIQEVGDIRQSTSPGLFRQSQKLDAAVDGKFSNNPDLTYISARYSVTNYPKVPAGISTRALG